jgi:hypothetical protein
MTITGDRRSDDTTADESGWRSSWTGRLLIALLRPSYRWLRHTSGTVMFDRRYGVHTEEHVEVADLHVASPDAVGYIPCNQHLLPLVLPRREVTTDDVLLDAGSGMGRVVLQAAARYPFRRVVGVELSEQLHAIATANLVRSRARLACPDVSLVNADILDFDGLDEVTVVFLYNPFGGATFEEFARRLVASVDRRPRDLRVVYVNPREEATLLDTDRFRRVRSRRLGRWLARVYLLTP